MKKVIFFDLDDTLILEKRAMDDALYSTCLYVYKYGYTDPSSLVSTVKETARELWHQLPTYNYCLQIGISSWEGLWAKFLGNREEVIKLNNYKNYYQINTWKLALQKHGIYSNEAPHMLSARLNEERRKRQVLFPDTLRCLKSLKEQYKLAIITNGLYCLQMEKIQSSNLSGYFDNIIISGELGYAKPKEQIFAEALIRCNVKKEQAIMVGDSIESDILGANNFGIKAIWINRLNRIINNNGLIEISSLDSLLSVLEYLNF